MLLAQWGRVDQLAGDPSIWLCYQCNDCNVRCPRDAQPGDVMQAMRATVVENLAAPAFMGRLVGSAKSTWPILLGLPLLFWIVILFLTTGLVIPHVETPENPMVGPFFYEHFVPHAHIYVIFTTAVLLATIAAGIGAFRFCRMISDERPSGGSFIGSLIAVVGDIAVHNRFSQCAEGNRRTGHLALMWGFVGAAITSGLLIPYLYKDTLFSWLWLPMRHSYPLPVDHPVKWLGNISALALVIGGALLLMNRLRADRRSGTSTAFDTFFLWTVLGIVGTGVLAEMLRFFAPPTAGCLIYLLHLSLVLTLFVTFPFSKFAHILYRTLAMIHQKMTETTS